MRPSERGAGATGSEPLRRCLVAEEQWREGALEVPGDVGREQAEEQVSAHAVLAVVVDGAHLELDGLEVAEGPLGMGQALVGEDHGAGRGQLGGGHAGADDVEPVERGLGGDGPGRGGR